MHCKRKLIFLAAAGVILVAAASLWLMWAAPASAQCGSQASSCKNCHEVQGKHPVNNDGTGWHTAHAFGDFCYICHAGNNQAAGADEAHAGMVAPLADIKASCQQCHPVDLQERAQVYATALGVEIGAAAAPASPPAASETASTAPAASENASTAPAAVDSLPVAEIAVDDPNLVDFVQRYNEIVLGKRPLNVGNAILVAMIALVGLGGGGFVIYNETQGRRSRIKTKKAAGEFPAEIVDLLPLIQKLNPKSRLSLKKILENPQKTETVLRLIDVLAQDGECGEKTL